MTEDNEFFSDENVEQVRKQIIPKVKCRFPGQRDNEEIRFILRRHKITLLPTAIIFFCLAFLPLAAYSLFLPLAFSAFLDKPYSDIYFLLITIYYGFLWIILFIEWLDYYLDIWIITNQRILSIEQQNLFHRMIAELDLKRVQDITSKVDGAWQTFFKFGDIKIQTASEESVIKPMAIPHPVIVRREIMNLCKAAQDQAGWGVN